VCRNVADGLRRRNLYFEHHYTVAKLPPSEQGKWLALAEKHNTDGRRTLSFRNDKVRRSSSPTNPQNPKSVRGNLLLHNKKFPLGEMGVLLVTCGSYCWMRPRRLCYSETSLSG